MRGILAAGAVAAVLAMTGVAGAPRAQATIYFVAFDPDTGAMAMADSSSGGPGNTDQWEARVKDKGMVGAGGLGLCRDSGARNLLEQDLSAVEIADRLYTTCAQSQPYFRLAIVTRDGVTTTKIGPTGCNPDNEYCGAVQLEHFATVGGGLQQGVLEATAAAYQARSTDQPFVCQVFDTLKAAHAAGGEILDFNSATITIDLPGDTEQHRWQSLGAERTLLPGLVSQLRASGIECAGFASIQRMAPAREPIVVAPRVITK